MFNSVLNGQGDIPVWIGVDVGGTKVRIGLVTSDGQILARAKELTTHEGGSALVEQIVRLVRRVIGECHDRRPHIQAMGIGLPAIIDRSRGLVRWMPNVPGCENLLLGERLKETLQVPVYLEYDGHTGVVGEHWCGAGKGLRNIAFIIVGTGIGGGLVLDNRLYRGTVGVAGAVGWFVTDILQLDCTEPSPKGWLETLAAGPGITRRTLDSLRQTKEEESILREKREAGEITPDDVFRATLCGDVLAARIVSETGKLLGMAIANVVSLLDLQMVILGGGIGSTSSSLLTSTTEIVERNSQPFVAQNVEIRRAELGEDGGILGAARLAMSDAESLAD